jgi:metal transporter CNNM
MVDSFHSANYDSFPLISTNKSSNGSDNQPSIRRVKSRHYHSIGRTVIFGLLFLTLFVSCTFSHVLPVEGGTNAIQSRSPHQQSSVSQLNTSILDEWTSSLKSNTVEDVQRNINYSPSTKTQSLVSLTKRQSSPPVASTCACDVDEGIPKGREIAFAILVVVLVLLSGCFAGLTLGYMSLDETQLQVLMTTGDEVQRMRAAKIIPIRKDGHLLLTTLLIANMITNEVSNRAY